MHIFYQSHFLKEIDVSNVYCFSLHNTLSSCIKFSCDYYSSQNIYNFKHQLFKEQLSYIFFTDTAEKKIFQMSKSALLDLVVPSES